MTNKRLTVIIETIDENNYGKRICRRIKPEGMKISDFMLRISKELKDKEESIDGEVVTVKEPIFYEKDRNKK